MQTNTTPRQFDIIRRRRYDLVAEWLGSRENGQRTARWFHDKQTDQWHMAESWKRPNLNRPVSGRNLRRIEQLIAAGQS